MDVFEKCGEINDLIASGEEVAARDEVIYLLDNLRKMGATPDELVNHLVRQVGLYPYMIPLSSHWHDRLAQDAFRVDVGAGKELPLHRDQSMLLSKLLSGKSVAVSAPTSFGKSFVIDAFISVAKPRNVLIIVPTIALMDEARRRLHCKFSTSYRIVTTSDVEDLSGNNIFIFPQERAISYINRIEHLDLMIVDEFYKAAADFDKERSPVLVRAMLKFSEKAAQKYYLAPNISGLADNFFTRGMEFIKLDFNTVVLRRFDRYKELVGSAEQRAGKKKGLLLEVLSEFKGKTLIYAGSYQQVSSVSAVLSKHLPQVKSLILADFSKWLTDNYSVNWDLPKLVLIGVGIHNGQLHRPISQIQVRLFEDVVGMFVMVSTSSIIEGVNTSAENVVIWNNKNGSSKLTDFEFKNVMGRSGRMFKHFVGNVFVLEDPPVAADRQLEISIPDSLLGLSDISGAEQDLSEEQVRKSAEVRSDLSAMMGEGVVDELYAQGRLQTSDSSLLRRIAADISQNPSGWRSLAHLNSNNVDTWTTALYKAININNAIWDAPFGQVVSFVKVLSGNWRNTIPQMLVALAPHGIGVEQFFKLERTVTYKLSSLLGDINSLHQRIVPGRGFDISPFVFRLAHSFLPPVVYQLEELGLPRMLSRKISKAGIVNFNIDGLTLAQAIDALKLERGRIDNSVLLNSFERYLLDFFFEGV
jgi:hypothetical protein